MACFLLRGTEQVQESSLPCMLRGKLPQRLWQKALTDENGQLCHDQRCCARGRWTRWHTRSQAIRGI